MRKNTKKLPASFLTIFLSFSLVFSYLNTDGVAAYITQFGSTQIVDHEQIEIGKGVVLDNWQGINPDDSPKLGHTITFDPISSDAQLTVAYGDTINSRKTLSTMSSTLEKQQGVSIIGGINGDYYHLVNGVPVGIVIKDGKLISCSATKWSAIGFKADGTAVIGNPEIDVSAMYNDTQFGIGNFNKAQGDWGPYLYSSDFGPNTGSTVSSLEIILNINGGDIAVGKGVVATVSEIRSDTKATPIGPNQLVLSSRIGKTGQYVMSKLKVGDVVAFQFNDKEGQWGDVKDAIGGATILINNSVIQPGLSSTNFNPVTSIGVKANGEVVLFEVDGRNDSVSQGVSSLEGAQFLYNLGCVKAIELDGGGSSTILARMPGYRSPTVINIPSDGKERANSNGLLLVSKQSVNIKNGTAQVNPVAQKINIYPRKAYALPGAKIKYIALATDEYYLPTSLPPDLAWGTNAGTLDQNGILTAATQPGTYQIIAGGGMGYGTAELTVLDSVSSLKPSKSNLTLQPGDTEDLSCEAYYNGKKVSSDDTSFTWQVEGDIGTITNDGIFTVSPTAQGAGRIAVRYGSLSTYIDVVISDSTGSIEDFENGLSWGSSIVRAKSGNAAVIEDSSLARSGTKLLKVDYDFSLDTGVEKGVAGVYAYRTDPNTGAQVSIPLSQNPSAIGMYVYGDNSRTWIRAKLKDGKGQSFDIDFVPDYRADTKIGGVDWNGWKYVEAKIPSNRQGPFVIDTPIRVMCSRDEMRTKGTLYFDRIRLVYGESQVDNQPPVATITSPASLSINKSGKLPFQATISDNGSGVDTKSVQTFIDGLQVTDLKVTTSGVITVSGELGNAFPLADGLHTLIMSFSDIAGNKGSVTLNFSVDTGSPQIITSSSQTFYSGGNFTTTVSAKNPKNLKKVYITFSYDPATVELVDADTKTKGKQIALEAWVKKGKVIKNSVDESKGQITLEVDNLTNLSSNALSKIGTITFKAKTVLQAATSIRPGLSAIIVGKNKLSQRFTLNPMNINFDYGMTLKAYGFSEGDITSFTLTDRNGNPVEGASLLVNDSKDSTIKTDKLGNAQTTLLTKLPVGTVVTVQANKAGVISNKVTFTISEKASGLLPQNLNITLTSSQGSIAMNYITPKDQAGTLVQFIEKASFKGSFSADGVQAALGTDIETSLVNLKKTDNVRVHSVVLENLKPGTAYVYRFGDASGKFSSAYEFTTPNYDKPYSFVFVTDPQSVDVASYQVFVDVLKRGIEKAADPSFILMGGDLADRGGNKGLWDMMFNTASQIFSSYPIAVAPGNHEYADDANLKNFTSYFTLPENGPAGYKEDAYSFQTKDALFLVLDTQKPLQKQLEWLESTCKSSDKKWKIVVMHRGIYSGFYDEADLRKVAGPSFDRAGIDLVLNGHDHTYLRTTMKAGKKVAPGAGTTYVTGGSSAKKYYDAKKRAWTEVLYDANNPVFTTFKVSADRITVVSYHIEKGATVEHDRFDIIKK